MAGLYCCFCGHRCFVYRVLPDFSWDGLLSTCPDGAANARQKLGYDYTTALDLTSPEPEGLQVRQVDGTDRWRVVHTESGKYLPLVDWPPAGLPHQYAQVAAASLSTSGIDWTRSASDLIADLCQVADAVRTASTIAYDAAIYHADRTDDRPPPCDLATRRARQQIDHEPRSGRTHVGDG